MSVVDLPRALGPKLQENDQIIPIKYSIDLKIQPLSTASMTVFKNCLKIHDFVKLYTQSGCAGIFRVASVEDGFEGSQNVELEHGITVLGDALIPGEGTKEGTPRSLLQEIFAHQTTGVNGVMMWKLGAVEAPDSIPLTYNYNYSNLLEALNATMAELDGYMLEFDQSAFPWTANVRALPTEISCEGRLSRNIASLNVRYDDSELCTRVYAPDLPGGYLESESAKKWGVIGRSLGVNDDIGADLQRKYAEKYLKERGEPTISVELDALDLSAATGESLDRFVVGSICRLALPEYKTVVNQRIVALSYSDVYGQPESIRVSLANQMGDASDRIAGLLVRTTLMQQTIVSQRKAIKGNAQNIRINAESIEVNAKSILANAEQIVLRATTKELDETRKLVNEAWIDIDGLKALIVLKASQEEVDSVKYRLSQAEVSIDGANAQIALKASQREVTLIDERVSQAEIAIDGVNAAIALKASKDVTEALEKRVSNAEVNIDGANAQIALKASKQVTDALGTRVSQAEIAIDGANSKITLKANKVDLDALITEVNGLKTGGIKADSLYTARLIVTNSTFHLGEHDATWRSLDVCTGVHYNVTNRYAMAPSGTTSMSFKEVTRVWGDFETLNFVGR